MKVFEWYVRWIGSLLSIALGLFLVLAGFLRALDSPMDLSSIAAAVVLAAGGIALSLLGVRRRGKLLDGRRKLLQRHRSRETKRGAGWLRVSCLGVAGVAGVEPGQGGWMRVVPTGLELQPDRTDGLLTLHVDDIGQLEVAGPGEVRNGPRFFGGGFGWQGAITGILTAEALNALLGQKEVQTILSMVTETGTEATWITGDILPDVLHQQLAPLRAETRRRSSAAASAHVQPEGSLTDELLKLQQLREFGTLTEDEFTAAKRQLLT